jgi:hypothetical protein
MDGAASGDEEPDRGTGLANDEGRETQDSNDSAVCDASSNWQKMYRS